MRKTKMNDIGHVTISMVDVAINASISATINIDKSVDPMIFLTNFQRWTESNDFKYHWFRDYVLFSGISNHKTYKEFYDHFIGNWVMDNMPIGYDSKQTIIMFNSTMIAKAPLEVTIDNVYIPVKGHIINGKLHINDSYLTDENDLTDLNSALYLHILDIHPGEDKMDVYIKTKELNKRCTAIIKDAKDGVETYIEEIDFIFTKNIDVDIETLKSMIGVLYK